MGQHAKVRYYIITGFLAFEISTEWGDACEFAWFSMGKDWNQRGLEQTGNFYVSGERLFK